MPGRAERDPRLPGEEARSGPSKSLQDGLDCGPAGNLPVARPGRWDPCVPEGQGARARARARGEGGGRAEGGAVRVGAQIPI